MRTLIVLLSLLLAVSAKATPPIPCPPASGQNVVLLFRGEESGCQNDGQPCFRGERIALTPVSFGHVVDRCWYWFMWDFGDGTTASSPARAALHAYGMPGEYSVTLTIYSPVQMVKLSQLVRVISTCDQMNAANTFIFYRGETSRCDPQSGIACRTDEPVEFTAWFYAYQPICEEHHYLWDFGDGTTASGRIATHPRGYAQPGVYRVRLTILNSIQTMEVERFVTVEQGPRRRSARH